MRFSSVICLSLMLASAQAVELTQQSSLALQKNHNTHPHKKHHSKAKHHRAAEHKKVAAAAAHPAVVTKATAVKPKKVQPNADDIGAAGDSTVATVTADTDRVNAGADAADKADAANAADSGAVEEKQAPAEKPAVEKPAPKAVVKPAPAAPVSKPVEAPAAVKVSVEAKKPSEEKKQKKTLKHIKHDKTPTVDVKKPNFAKKNDEKPKPKKLSETKAPKEEAPASEVPEPAEPSGKADEMVRSPGEMDAEEPKDVKDAPLP